MGLFSLFKIKITRYLLYKLEWWTVLVFHSCLGIDQVWKSGWDKSIKVKDNNCNSYKLSFHTNVFLGILQNREVLGADISNSMLTYIIYYMWITNMLKYAMMVCWCVHLCTFFCAMFRERYFTINKCCHSFLRNKHILYYQYIPYLNKIRLCEICPFNRYATVSPTIGAKENVIVCAMCQYHHCKCWCRLQRLKLRK